MAKLRTTLLVGPSGFRADMHEVEVDIAYTAHRGCAARLYGDYPHPAEDDSVSINSITVIETGGDTYGADWLTGVLEDDDEIIALCLADWREDCIAGEEARAEARAEMLREERA